MLPLRLPHLHRLPRPDSKGRLRRLRQRKRQTQRGVSQPPVGREDDGSFRGDGCEGGDDAARSVDEVRRVDGSRDRELPGRDSGLFESRTHGAQCRARAQGLAVDGQGVPEQDRGRTRTERPLGVRHPGSGPGEVAKQRTGAGRNQKLDGDRAGDRRGVPEAVDTSTAQVTGRGDVLLARERPFLPVVEQLPHRKQKHMDKDKSAGRGRRRHGVR
mmetsp:Transcript_8855/g.21559  ORF Transcript_8855/g.21559 Transcript_8855/m.21559 type:complete len:215 (-) Transcript_8855:962-1606(-)